MAPVPRAVLVTGILACLAVGGLATVVSAALYGDGSVMLIQAINAGGSFVERSRWLLNDLRDLPVVGLVRMGVTDTHLLSIAQSVGYVLVATCAWACTLFVSRHDSRQFVVFTIAAGMCLGTMVSFGAAELLLALSLVGLITALLARTDPWTWTATAAAVASAALLVIAHESLIAPAVLWGVHAGWRAWRMPSFRDRLGGLLVALAAVGCVLWGVTSLARVPDGGSQGFLIPMQTLTPASAVLLLAGGLAASLGLLSFIQQRTVAVVVVTAAVLAWTVAAVFVALRLGPGAGYAARAWCLLAVLLVQAVSMGLWARSITVQSTDSAGERSSGSRWPVHLALGYLLLALAIPVGNSLVWADGRDDVQRAVTAQAGLLDPGILSEAGQRALFSWTNPYLSVVLRTTPSDAVFVDPHPEFEAWTPGVLGSAAEAHAGLPEAYVWR